MDGGDGGDNYWYLGSTPCYRANAAFSLYGVLRPATGTSRQLKKRKNMCSEATFINSFFTTYGAMTISNALGLEYEQQATVACSSVQGSNNGGGSDTYNNYMSYTTGCESGKFVWSAFHGKFCDGNNFNNTVNTLDTYTANMESITCTQIWDYDVSVGGNRDRRELGYGSLAETILYYSKACSTTEYPGVCPDPFGRNAQYVSALSGQTTTYHSKAQQRLGAFSWFCFLIGAALAGLSVFHIYRKKRLATGTKESESVFVTEPDTDSEESMVRSISRVASVVSAKSVASVKSVAASVKSVTASVKEFITPTEDDTTEKPFADMSEESASSRWTADNHVSNVDESGVVCEVPAPVTTTTSGKKPKKGVFGRFFGRK